MKKFIPQNRSNRQGAIAAFVAILLVPLLGFVALSVDYAYLLKVRTDMQRAADASALAAVRDLLPEPDGSQDLDQVQAVAREYVQLNMQSASFAVLDSDIDIGRYDPDTIYSKISILNTGTFDTVLVTLRHDNQANSPVPLFFAKALGIFDASLSVTATTVLQKVTLLEPGAEVLPFSIHEDVWNSLGQGDAWSIYGDGRIEDAYGDTIPGNWGTVDIGAANNSTAALSDQIRNGLRQEDLDALFYDGRILTNSYIDAAAVTPVVLQADTGLSSGLQHAVQDIHGESKIVPIYDFVIGSGNNTEYRIVSWGVVQVVDSNWAGANDTYVKVKKSYMYDAHMSPQPDLSNTSGVIEGVFTSPVLVE